MTFVAHEQIGSKVLRDPELCEECLLHDQTQARFPLQPCRSETYRISLFREHSSKTNDMDTIEYVSFRYDTVKVENGLYWQ